MSIKPTLWISRKLPTAVVERAAKSFEVLRIVVTYFRTPKCQVYSCSCISKLVLPQILYFLLRVCPERDIDVATSH